MKKRLILGLAMGSMAIAGVGAFVYSLPYLTVSNIIRGIIENDPEILDDNIDFPRLQSNLKSNVQKALNEARTEQSSTDNPWEAFGQEFAVGFFGSIAETLIEKTVTPTALGSISIESKKRGFFYYLPDAKLGYRSFNKFQVSKQNEFLKTTLVLSRRGLHWELTNVTLSNINTDAIAKEIETSWQEEIAQYLPKNQGYSSPPPAPEPTPQYSPDPPSQYSPEPQTVARNSSRPNPEEFIIDHYGDLNNRDYSVTWNQLSQNFSRSLSYDDYTNWWYSVSEIQLNNVSLLSQSGDTATIRADLTYVMNDGKVVKDKKPFITLIWDDGSDRWLINDKGN